jgi:pyruvate,water dikinase
MALSGAIQHPDDVFWLESQEAENLAAALDAGEAIRPQHRQVSARKTRWQRARAAYPPYTLPQQSFLKNLLVHDNPKGNVLKGYAASAGRITAAACVLRGPEDFGRMRKGDVIVTVTTTPAWTPLFALASAVVTDIGGPLSHSSIVAREYGIPAVMATGVATKRIHDGQSITVDGSAGTVTLNAD